MAHRVVLTHLVLVLAASAEEVCSGGSCDAVSMLQTNEIKKTDLHKHAATTEHDKTVQEHGKGSHDKKGSCETATGGTCNIAGCDDWRGPTSCLWGWQGYYCACSEENYCATSSGSCVPSGCVNVDESSTEHATCFGHIKWAKEVGVKQHSQWYNGTALTADTPHKIFQFDFWKNHPEHECPPPCVPTPMN